MLFTGRERGKGQIIIGKIPEQSPDKLRKSRRKRTKKTKTRTKKMTKKGQKGRQKQGQNKGQKTGRTSPNREAPPPFETPRLPPLDAIANGIKIASNSLRGQKFKHQRKLYFVQRFSKTLRVMDVCAEDRGILLTSVFSCIGIYVV